MNANGGAGQQKDRNDLQKEVLAALFDGPERFDELPGRRMTSAKRPIALGELVEGPLIDFAAEQKVDRVHSQEDKKDGMCLVTWTLHFPESTRPTPVSDTYSDIGMTLRSFKYMKKFTKIEQYPYRIHACIQHLYLSLYNISSAQIATKY